MLSSNMKKHRSLPYKTQPFLSYLVILCIFFTSLLQITLYMYNEQMIESIQLHSNAQMLKNYDTIGRLPLQYWKNSNVGHAFDNDAHTDQHHSSDLCSISDSVTQKCQLKRCTSHASIPNKINFSNGYAGNTFKVDDPISDWNPTPNVGGAWGWESGCVISHKHKFIYIHVLKSGGTSMKNFLKKGLCGSSNAGVTCPEGKAVFDTDSMKCSDMIQNYPDYFTWSMARNPFSRMFSAYSMSLVFAKTKKISFENFVLNNRLRKHATRMSSDHYLPQVDFLFNQNECPIFDFLGKLENLEEDMSYILDKIGSLELQEFFQSQNKEIERKNTWGDTRRKQIHNDDLRLAYENEEVRRAVAEEFAQDFRLLGYDSAIVPLS